MDYLTKVSYTIEYTLDVPCISESIKIYKKNVNEKMDCWKSDSICLLVLHCEFYLIKYCSYKYHHYDILFQNAIWMTFSLRS